jgi:hypothetical protein
MIKKFDQMPNKRVAVYHGLGGGPNPERISYLKSLGYRNIYYPFIDFEDEWDYDKGKSLFYSEVNALKNVDIIIGFSLGGYLAFELAGYLSKDLILVNPAIDRSKTKLAIKSFDIEPKRNFKKVEVFLGTADALIDKNIPINYLKELNIKADISMVEGMEHGTPINYFMDIVNKSKLL